MSRGLMLVLLVFSFLGNAQHPFFPMDSIKPNAGFYRNFTEFRLNKPSVPLPDGMTVFESGQFIRETFPKGLDEALIGRFGVDNISKEYCNKIGSVYGFCDGKDFYLVHNPHFKKVTMFQGLMFCKFDYLGLYSIYTTPNLKKKTNQAGGVNQSYFLNINTGECRPLNFKNVSPILKKDSVKIDEVKDSMQELLVKYSEKHKEKIKSELKCNLIIYRHHLNQDSEPINIMVNGVIYTLEVLSHRNSRFLFREIIGVCSVGGDCIAVSPEINEPIYIECSKTLKDEKPVVKLQNREVGQKMCNWIDKQNVIKHSE